MKQISIVMCSTWGGTNYSQESVEAFYDYSNAVIAMDNWQGRQQKCDVEYYIEVLEIGDSVE